MIKPTPLSILASMALFPTDLSSLSSAPSAAAVLSIASMASFALRASSAETESAATDVDARARECTEPGTCEGNDVDVANAVDDAGNASTEIPPNPAKAEEEAAKAKTTTTTTTTTQQPPPGSAMPPLIFESELSLKIGKGGASPENQIWLSILGKVYDVTAGEDYYGEEKGGYRYYAGRDASACFSSGKNDDDGSAEDWTQWEDSKLVPILEWARFYQDHEVYRYLGVYAGSQWFDMEGNQTERRKEFVGRAVPYELKMHEEKMKKKKERAAARAKKKREKDQKAKGGNAGGGTANW